MRKLSTSLLILSLSCVAEVALASGDITPEAGIFAGLAIAIGLVAAFWGYRLFNLLVLLSTGLASGGGLYLLLQEHASGLNVWIRIGISVGVGLVTGLAFYFINWLRFVGMFVFGAVAAGFLAVYLQSMKSGGLIPNQIGAYFFFGGCALAGGILISIRPFAKFFIITASSFGGSFAAAIGVDRFLKGDLGDTVSLFFRGHFENINLTLASKILLGITAGIAVIGFFVQFFVTGKNWNHVTNKQNEEEEGTPLMNKAPRSSSGALDGSSRYGNDGQYRFASSSGGSGSTVVAINSASRGPRNSKYAM